MGGHVCARFCMSLSHSLCVCLWYVSLRVSNTHTHVMCITLQVSAQASAALANLAEMEENQIQIAKEEGIMHSWRDTRVLIPSLTYF